MQTALQVAAKVRTTDEILKKTKLYLTALTRLFEQPAQCKINL